MDIQMDKFKMSKASLDNLRLVQKVYMGACRDYYICKARLKYFLNQNPKWIRGYELEAEYVERFGDLDEKFKKEVDSHEED